VVNKPMDGANVMVKVAEGATWDVTSDSYIKALVNEGAVNVADGATLYINGEAYTGEVPTGEAGDLAAGAGAKVDTSEWVVGENYRTEATGNYDNIVIDGNAYYYVGYSEPVTGVAILDVAFQMHGWLVVDEDGNYTVSEEYVALDEPDSSGGESAEGESAEGESAEGESPAEGAPAGEAPAAPAGEAPAAPAGEAPAAPAGEAPAAPAGEAPAAPAEDKAAAAPAGEAPAAPAEDKAEAAPAEKAPAVSEEELKEAYIKYIHEWLLAEDEVNDAMDSNIVENEFMPLVEKMDFTSFPADMLFNGMLENGVAMTFEEFAKVYKPAADDKAASSEDDMLEAYKKYMIEWLNAENEINEAMTDEQIPEFMACIEANDYSQFPGDMFFNGMLESGSAMTYDEFIAASK